MITRWRIAGFVLAALLAGSAAADVADRSTNAVKTYPRQVLIIRHAEKPPAEEKSAELTSEGKARAESLFSLFEVSERRSKPFPTPDFIFAAKDSKSSSRPRLTVEPLAGKLKLTIDSRFGNDDADKLVEELHGNPKYADKIVLISWRHTAIPQLAAKLGATDAPVDWPGGEVYDRVWRIAYDKSGKASFIDLPQQLMPKDAVK